MIKFIIALIFVSPSINAGWIPQEVDTQSRTELNLRSIGKSEKYSSIIDLRYRDKSEIENELLHLRIGKLKRLHKNFKLGGFVELASGLRHENDWQLDDGQWKWIDSSKRVEAIATMDATYRYRLPSVFNRIVFELKNRFSYNSYNSQQSLRVRPGLNYFWIKDGHAFINILLQHEIYHPLNYGKTSPYERWNYLSILYHVDQNHRVGPFYSESWKIWHESEETVEKDASWEYEFVMKEKIVGINYIFVY